MEENNIMTVTLSKSYYNETDIRFKVGDKIRAGKITTKLLSCRIKKYKMISRLKKKEWHPIFIVTYINTLEPFNYSLNLKPYNF